MFTYVYFIPNSLYYYHFGGCDLDHVFTGDLSQWRVDKGGTSPPDFLIGPAAEIERYDRSNSFDDLITEFTNKLQTLDVLYVTKKKLQVR